MPQASGYLSGAVAPDSTHVIPNSSYPSTIVVFPGSGASVLVEYSLTVDAFEKPDQANWLPWPSGSVIEATCASIVAPARAFRVSVSGGSGDTTWEVAY